MKVKATGMKTNGKERKGKETQREGKAQGRIAKIWKSK